MKINLQKTIQGQSLTWKSNAQMTGYEANIPENIEVDSYQDICGETVSFIESTQSFTVFTRDNGQRYIAVNFHGDSVQ